MTAAQYREMMQGGGTAKTKSDYINRCSNDRGRTFENLIMDGCEAYAREGRAIINKVYEPYRCIRILEDGKFIGQFVGRAEPDFKGVLNGGRAVAFEAKSTNKSRIQRNALTDEQMEWLEVQQTMGALAFVCVQIQGQFFSVPWNSWRDMKTIYGKKFLMPGDMKEFRVRFDGGVKFLDYVSNEIE